MDIKKLERDYLTANAKSAISILNASGWQKGIVNIENLDPDSVFFYAFDHQSQWMWCCSVPRAFFLDIVRKCGQLSPTDREGLPGTAETMISQSMSKASLGVDEENQLAIRLSAYVSMTRSYQLTEEATKANHFVVIRYGATHMMRPFVLSGPKRHLLVVEDVMEAIEQVIGIDSKNHPEWIGQK